MRYIDTDKLIAEIEWRIAQWQPYTFACASQIASEAFDRIDELKGLLIYVTSLQQKQPEVDLEEEITKWIEAGDITDTRFDDYDDSDIERTALHFYELARLKYEK